MSLVSIEPVVMETTPSQFSFWINLTMKDHWDDSVVFCSKGHVYPTVWRLCPLPESYQCTDMGKGSSGEGPGSWAIGDGCGWYTGTLEPLGFSATSSSEQ